MTILKKVLAILALCSMALFVLSIIFLTVTGTLAQHSVLVYGSLTAFLLFGLLSLGINWLMKQKQ